MKISSLFNHHVPKDVNANLKWRASVHHRVIDDPEYANVIRDACSKDPLFFINGFGWTYDPRRQPFPKLPFILYPFQEKAILEIIEAIGSHDLLIEKSRDMGASWICSGAIEWCWQWKKAQSFLMVSRVEEYVDKPGNPKALFWKIDYLLDNLPEWLKPNGYDPDKHRRLMHIENPENDSVIDGESTTGNVARGDRRTAILLDEFAAVQDGHRVLSSTRDATNCRLFNSTPSGTGNAFFDIRQTGIKKIRLHWSQHPIKSKGLYTTDDQGKLKILDPTGYPEGYEPILDGKLRSPWYDNECKRAVNSREIAQEVDIDYLGSGGQAFDATKVQVAINTYARDPMFVGDLEYDHQTGEPIKFRESPDGKLKLWFLLDKDGNPPRDHKYSLGNDISAGTGASNSCGSAWDITTCSKSLEYTNPYARPEGFATQMVAIAKWLGKAFMIWEANGPGRQFGAKVKELNYNNIYLRKNDESIKGKVSDIPGVAQNADTKDALICKYRDAIESCSAINYSREALNETLEYIWGPDGHIVHSRANNKIDPSGAKANHGDRAMADVLAHKGMTERKANSKKEEPETPYGSLAWRKKMRELENQKPLTELTAGWR